MERETGLGRRRSKIFNDPVHGLINIKGVCLDVLDTPEFQRLRYIRQLGACYFVYPSAQHSRLEHSLGTAHLAEEVVTFLRSRQPGLRIRQEDFDVVSLAGLCHDLGHGCFSHSLDNTIFPQVVDDFDWHHETRSCEILERIVDRHSIDLDKSTVSTVQSMILGDPSKARWELDGKRFLWDVVANSRHGIDVDKFDYLARDSRQCNIKIGFDHSRVIKLMKVVQDEICFDARAADSVYELFHARASMYRHVYVHRAVRAVEHMITEALVEANHVLRLHECMHNLDKFLKLDDSILRTILHSDDPSLAKSQSILQRVERRQLYRLVDEFVVPADHLNGFRNLSPDEFFRHKSNGFAIRQEDVVIQNLKIDYGRGGENPVNLVGFFDDRERGPLRKHFIPRERVSNMVPQNYKDVTVRVYIKERNSRLEDEAREMFLRYQMKTFGKEVMRTPSLKRKLAVYRSRGDDEHEDSDFVYPVTEDTGGVDRGRARARAAANSDARAVLKPKTVADGNGVSEGDKQGSENDEPKSENNEPGWESDQHVEEDKDEVEEEDVSCSQTQPQGGTDTQPQARTQMTNGMQNNSNATHNTANPPRNTTARDIMKDPSFWMPKK